MGETSTSGEPAQTSLDDIDEDENDDDDDDPAVKETPARKLRSLKAICRTLLESAHIHKPVDASWVRKSAFAKDPISDEECNVVCMIVNTLRPCVPRRNHRIKQDGTKTSIPPPVVCLRAPIVLISNAVMHATKHPEFARRIAPHSSVGTPIAPILGAPGLYETLCRPKSGYFDVKDHIGRAITNAAEVTSPAENKRSVLGGFFDIELVEKICSKHDLDFAQRRKENNRDYGDNWKIEFSKCGKSVQELEYEVAEVSTDVANLEKEIRVMKTEIEKLTNDKRTLPRTVLQLRPKAPTDSG
ncbi:hypothetical protein BGX31_004228 [Mortierella sp. GBA43]|nr:hypothetical protein BGX31_004228 [Mortierella sp. GBA43]